jgi:hypothetical protein
MSYTYKNTNISNLIMTGGGSLSPKYTPFPGYAGSPSYETEKPLPFGVKQNNVEVSTLMTAKYVDLPVGQSVQYLVPSDYNAIRAVLEGGGGGGGGGGSCGVDGKTGPGSRNPSGYGGPGTNGGFVYISDTLIAGGTNIVYTVGNGGAAGGGAPDAGDLGQVAQQSPNKGGDGQAGQDSTITFFTSPTISYTVTANGGSGGIGGSGGKGGTPAAPQAVINYSQGSLYSTDGNQQVVSIPTNVNPISYKQSYSVSGFGGPDNNPGGPGTGSPGQGGQRGYIRLYLLKE